MEEASFAEKLRIQATDKKAALREDFIDRTTQSIKVVTERFANEGYLECKLESGSIPEVLLLPTSNKTQKLQIIEDIILDIQTALKDCGFTKLAITTHTQGFGIGSTLAIHCQWN